MSERLDGIKKLIGKEKDSEKVISELIYLNPVKIGETALKELFEYRTKGYSNSYVTVATQIIKSRW